MTTEILLSSATTLPASNREIFAVVSRQKRAMSKKEEDVSKIFDAALEKFMFLGKGSSRRVKPSERKVSAMCANSEQGDLLAGGG